MQQPRAFLGVDRPAGERLLHRAGQGIELVPASISAIGLGVAQDRQGGG